MEPPEETLDIAQFNALPDELKEHIISSRPDLIAKLSRVNRNFYDLSVRPYLERLCSRPIQQKEVQGYIATTPLIVGTHYCYSGPYADYDIDCSTDVYIRRPRNDYVRITLFSGINMSPLELEIQTRSANINHIVISETFEYDLITQYNILRNRLGCVQRHADYAKEYILRDQDDRYHTIMAQFKDPHVEFSHKVANQISLFHILWMNAYAFNISPSVIIPTGDIQDIPAFMNSINKEIPRLYTAIRKAIMRLD